MLLPRIFLVLMQIGGAYYFAPKIRAVVSFIPDKGGALELIVYAVIIALLVWLVGHVGGVVLKDVSSPSPTTLSYTLVGALIVAVLVAFIPDIHRFVTSTLKIGIEKEFFSLIGAIIGYFIKK